MASLPLPLLRAAADSATRSEINNKRVDSFRKMIRRFRIGQAVSAGLGSLQVRFLEAEVALNSASASLTKYTAAQVFRKNSNGYSDGVIHLAAPLIFFGRRAARDRRSSERRTMTKTAVVIDSWDSLRELAAAAFRRVRKRGEGIFTDFGGSNRGPQSHPQSPDAL